MGVNNAYFKVVLGGMLSAGLMALSMQSANAGSLESNIQFNSGTQSGSTSQAITAPTQTTTTTDPYKFQDGPLTLLNCYGRKITVWTYKPNDVLLQIPFKTYTINNGQSKALECGRRNHSCKIAIPNRWKGIPKVSGYNVYVHSKLRTTNQQTMARGCSAYPRY